LCEIDNVLGDLPQGDQTRLTEGGLNLSLGQRQRVALARALLGKPAILLLDEADAHLDPGANEVLDRVLAKFCGTVLIVTHSPKRLANVDVIWKMNNGRLIEIGRPDEILTNMGSRNSLTSIRAS
jgi:ABC-type bacteriocin/lantibiotic exporter with double-glycine peptidase domain